MPRRAISTTAIKWSTKAVEIGDKEHDESLKKELESYKAEEALAGIDRPEGKSGWPTAKKQKARDEIRRCGTEDRYNRSVGSYAYQQRVQGMSFTPAGRKRPGTVAATGR